jgi:hypothetical protein
MKRPTKSITRREAPRSRLKPTLPARSKADRSMTQRVPGERIWCVKAQMTPSLSVAPPVFSKVARACARRIEGNRQLAVEFLKKGRNHREAWKARSLLSPIQTWQWNDYGHQLVTVAA